MGKKIDGIWGVIGAMASEVELLTSRMEEASALRHAGVDFHYGTLEGVPVVAARCGIGKVCAAVCAQAMIDRFHVAALVNTGVAGGVAPGLSVGDLVIGADAVQHDFDITAFGHAKGYMGLGPGPADDSQPTRFAADPDLVAAFRAAAESVPGSGSILTGTIASGDVFVADDCVKREIAAQFGAAAVEMEGAAVAQVAVANGVPFVIVRAISDLAGEAATVSFEEFEKAAAERSARIVSAMLRQAWGACRGTESHAKIRGGRRESDAAGRTDCSVC